MGEIEFIEDKSTIETEIEDTSALDDLLDCLEIEIQVNDEKYTVVDGSKFGGKRKKPIEVRDKDGHIHMYRVLSSDKNNEPYKILKDNPIDGVPRVENLQELKGETRIIEEKIDGLNLEEYYNIHSTLSEEKAWNFILQLCDILTELHHYDIIHNDIKRTNIMVDKNDKVWLIDFDASKILDRTKNPDKDIDTNRPRSPGYTTLEQANGVSIEATDIAHLGITFVKLLGNEKYNGIYKAILEKSKQYDYKLRYQSAKELKAALIDKKKVKEDILSYIEWFNFRGRINRTQFIVRMIITFLLLGLCDYLRMGEMLRWNLGYWIPALRMLAMLLFTSNLFKRLHDIGYPGYYSILLLIFHALTTEYNPFINYTVDIIATTVLFFYPGNELPNKYGDTQ